MSAAISVCACALICSVLSNIVSDGGTKKLVSLIMGAFVICSMISPVSSVISELKGSIPEYDIKNELSSTADQAYSNAVVFQTQKNLEQALSDLLRQNGIEINRCKIILALTENNSIIISSISIYISKDSTQAVDSISEITKDSFSVMPSIFTE